MTISRPTAALTLSGSASSIGGPAGLGGALDLAQAGVGRLTIDLSVDEAHDRAEFWLWHDSALIDAQPGDTVAIALDADDDPHDVTTVEVHGVDRTQWGAILTGFAPSRRLSDTYVGRAYVEQTLADVVNDLLGEGEVDGGDVDAVLNLPTLHIDPRRSVWGNLHRLANLTGHQITSMPDGAVSFSPIPGATGTGGLGGLAGAASGAASSLLGVGGSGELREGAELITFTDGARPAVTGIDAVTPASSAAAFILSAEPDSGSGAPVVVHPALRTRDAADMATSAASAMRSRATRRARVQVTGRPDLRAGGTVTARSEKFRILKVRHVIAPDTGFVSELTLEADQ